MVTVEQSAIEWTEHPEVIALAVRQLPTYCIRQRWYPGKGAGMPSLTLDELVVMRRSGVDAALAIWNVTTEDHEPFQILLPLAVISQEQAGRDARLSIGKLSDGSLLVDAIRSNSFVTCLVQLMLNDASSPSSNLQASHTASISALREVSLSEWGIKRSAAEQSNTSVRIGRKSILKVFRRLAAGIHPELEMARYLTEVAHFGATPAVQGWINLGDRTIGILQDYVPNEGDGWTWTRAQLRSGQAGGASVRKWLVRVGERTAEMHAALNQPSADAAFQSEAVESGDWQRWAQDLSAMAKQVRDALQGRSSNLDDEARTLAQEFNNSFKGLETYLASFTASPPAWHKTRHHGDYHLGQVLMSGQDAVIVDFEGEPLRSLEERRAKHIPLRDVAGMVRSIQYLSATLQRELSADLSPEARSEEVNSLNRWAAEAAEEFVESYLNRLERASSHPVDSGAARRIIDFFLIEKALYEVLYEISNRPAWAAVPLQYVVSRLRHMRSETQ